MHNPRSAIGLGLGIGLGLLLPACGMGVDDDQVVGTSPDEEKVVGSLMGRTTSYWTGTPPMVSVCWENPGTGNVTASTFTVSEATARSWIQEAIEQNWQRYARINFTGWGSCSTDTNIRIRIDKDNSNSAPIALGYGKEISKKSPGVRLSLYYNDTKNAGICKTSQATYRNCLVSDALHEFGHLLGFFHEEERSDYTGVTCGGTPGGKLAGRKYGAYDQRSIMSYCSDGVNGTRAFTSISPNDIAAVQRVYGRRIRGQIVSDNGYCVAANNFNPGNPGPKSFLFSCDEYADDQEWSWTPSSHRLSTHISSAPGYLACLTNGDMKINDCDGTLGQTFRMTDTTIRGWGGLCMDLTGGSQSDGTAIQSWECLGNANQLWSISDVGEIKLSANTSKCITVKNGSTTNGAKLVLQTCSGASSQKFTFGNGRIGFGGKCIDSPAVSDGEYVSDTQAYDGPANGWGAQVWDCISAQRNQLWNFSGPIKNAFGGCVDRGSGDGNGTNMSAKTCNASVGQTWDYYF